MTQKIACLFLFVLCMACSKDKNEPELAKRMLEGKTWFLDYSLQDNLTKSFIGRSTYYIQFKEDGTTIDADGIIGTYQIILNNNQLTLLVNGSTQNGVATNYNYQIVRVGYETLIVSYTQNNILIQKIFTTTH